MMEFASSTGPRKPSKALNIDVKSGASLASEGSPWALVSVTDKTGLLSFAAGLVACGYKLLSTGGTARILREAGLEVKEVADHTQSPEILDGRVKTLHPKIHGGLLFDRNDPSHRVDMERMSIEPIDLVVVNLYQFEKMVPDLSVPLEDAIHSIDVGGPSMLRAAAKNSLYVTTIVDPADYDRVLGKLRQGPLTAKMRLELAAKVFQTLASYDTKIAAYLTAKSQAGASPSSSSLDQFPKPPHVPSDLFAPSFQQTLEQDSKGALELIQILRYGENSQQAAALYGRPSQAGSDDGGWGGFSQIETLQGKELSYNNILDLDAATQLVDEFSEPAVVIVKHTNPCGVATEVTPLNETQTFALADLVARARACDPKSAFGGIIATNQVVDERAAQVMTEFFVECIAAPDFTMEARQVFARKPNLRLIKQAASQTGAQSLRLRSVKGGLLVQTADDLPVVATNWKVVTEAKLSERIKADLLLAEKVAKHVKSNAIVLAKDGQTLGIGAGQMSRIDAAFMAVKKAEEAGFDLRGSVLGSDAFFPFADTVEFAAKYGVVGIVQPGGSVKDQDSVQAADSHQMVMVMTGVRHFRH